MKEQLITFETSKLAKEKGFDLVCDALYYGEGNFEESIPNRNSGNPDSEIYSATTQSLLQKWLRKIYKTYVTPVKQKGLGYDLQIRKENEDKDYTMVYQHSNHLWDFEEALEEGLQEALKLIK